MKKAKGLADCIRADMLAFERLPNLPLARPAASAGVAANAKYEHLLTKLALFSPPLGVEGFAHEYHVKWTKKSGGSCSAVTCFPESSTSRKTALTEVSCHGKVLCKPQRTDTVKLL